MLNQTHSKTNFLKKQLDINFDLDHLKSMSYKKDEIYYTNNGELELKKEIVIESKNIFSVYAKSMYDLYLLISDYIKEICDIYELDINKQRYMIYGKVSKYGSNTNKNWYDFPGINIPYLHGMYFPDDAECEVSFNNNDSTIKEIFKKNSLFINKPTDIINIKTNKECEVIEFYISPLYGLKHNEPGVWVPIN